MFVCVNKKTNEYERYQPLWLPHEEYTDERGRPRKGKIEEFTSDLQLARVYVSEKSCQNSNAGKQPESFKFVEVHLSIGATPLI